MKKSKSILFIAAAMFYCIAALAQNPTQQVTALQYFYNDDPGVGVAGNGGIITVTPSATINQTFPINLAGSLSDGFHFLYVRAKDEYDRWSLAERKMFYIQQIAVTEDIVAYQYFFNSDPGVDVAGNGAIVPVSPTGDMNTTLAITVPGSLNPGFHHLYIRVKDSGGQWSMAERKAFYINHIAVTEDIVAYQYYFNTDPGVGVEGNGAIVPVSPTGNMNTTLAITVPGSLYPGFHHLYIRVKDSGGQWSIAERKAFYINQIAVTEDIVAYQYYFDTDPGVGMEGNGAIVDITQTADFNTTIYIPLPNTLTFGTHYLYVRTKDTGGQWSIAERVEFEVDEFVLCFPEIAGDTLVCQGTGGVAYTTEADKADYAWSVMGGTITAGDETNSITVTWDEAGMQTVSVTYTDPVNCDSVATTILDVEVIALPEPVITGDALSCEGAEDVVYTTEPGMNGYVWNVSTGGTITAGGTATDNTATITWNNSGSQWVSVDYTDPAACVTLMPGVKQVTVFENAPPAAITGLMPENNKFDIQSPITFAWDSAGNTSHYDLFIWRSNLQKPAIATVGNIADTGHIYAEYLNGNYLYNWQVKAKNICNDTLTLSEIRLFSFIPFPDLTVTNIVHDDTLTSGGSMDVNFTITNTGPGTTNWKAWKDDVYLSPSSEFDAETAVKVHTISNSSLLESGGNLNQSATFTIPPYLEGDYYVFVKTDGQNQLLETDETNNLVKSLDSVHFLMPPYPDLWIRDVTVLNLTIVPDSLLSLGWMVENIGDAPAGGGWSQKVSLVAPGKKITLGYVQYTDTLASTGVVSQTASFTVPKYPGMDGNVEVEVVLTPNPGLIEKPNSSGNNTAVTDEPVTLEKGLYIELPATLSESSVLPVQCKVFRSGSQQNELIVSLDVSEANRIIMPATVTIQPNQSGATFNISAIDNVLLEGDVQLTVTASAGSYPDKEGLITILDDEQPSLTLTISEQEATEGDTIQVAVSRNLVTASPLNVSLSVSKTGQVILPATVTIDPNESTIEFDLIVVDDLVPELTFDLILTANATGFLPGSDTITILDDDIPQIEFTIAPDTVSEGAGAYAAWGSVKRTVPGSASLTVVISAQPAGQVFFPTQVVIPGGVMEKQFNIGVIDNAILDGNRDVELTAAVWISSCGCGAPPESGGVMKDTLTILDNDGPSLSLSVEPFVIPEGLTNAGKLTVSRNTLGGDELEVMLQHNKPTEISLAASAIIPENENSVEVFFSTLDDGIEDGNQLVTISASADGYTPGSCWVMVSDQNLPDLTFTDLTLSASSLYLGEDLIVNLEVSNVGFATAAYGVQVNVYLSEDTQLDGGDILISSLLTGVATPPATMIPLADTIGFSGIVGDFYLIAALNENNGISELAYFNNTSAAVPLSILPDYNATVSVAGDIFNGKTPIPITGLVTGLDLQPAPNRLVDIYVVVDGVRRVYQTSSNNMGEITQNFQPLNGEAGQYHVGACFPGQGLNTAQDKFTVLGMKYTGSPLKWDVLLDETVNGSLEIRNSSNEPLTNVNVEVVSALTGCDLSFSPLGTLPGNGTMNVNYTMNVTDVSQGLYYQQVKLKITSAEGSDHSFTGLFYSKSPSGLIKTDPASLVTTMVKGKTQIREFLIQNIGLAETGSIEVLIPNVPWMTMISPTNVPSIPPGGYAAVSLQLTPTNDLPLNSPITGNLAINCANANNLSLPFSIETISEDKGDLLVNVRDEYTYYTPSGPQVANAQVILKHPFTGVVIVEGTTNQDGFLTANDIPEGYYTLIVNADQHQGYQNTVFLEQGKTNVFNVFISFQAITYTWNVVPTEIGDQYSINLTVVYETNVPAPVVLISMPDTMPQLGIGQQYPFLVTLTNVGLLAAQEVELFFPEDEEYSFFTNIDLLNILPQQSVQIPVIMERKTQQLNMNSTSNLNCYDVSGALYSYECGPNKRWQRNGHTFQYEGRVCFSNNIKGSGFIGTNWGDGQVANSDQQNVDPSSTTTLPVASSKENCSPCGELIFDWLIDCAICNIPQFKPICEAYGSLSCFWDFINYCLLSNTMTIECIRTIFNCYTIIGEIQDALNCIVDFVKIIECQGLLGSKSLNYYSTVYERIQLASTQLNATLDQAVEVYGDAEWISSPKSEVTYFLDYFTSLDLTDSINITPELIAHKPSNISNQQLQKFIERWNNSLNFENGLPYDPSNVIDFDLVYSRLVTIDSCETQSQILGYSSTSEMLLSEIEIVRQMHETESNSVCATVTLNFSQTLTMTREAFEGTLTIFNGHETTAMQDIHLDIEIRDENGFLKNDLFQINTLALNTMTGIDGSGTLDALLTGSAVVQFIPTKQAAPDIPVSYSFGGTLSYLDPFTNEVVTIPLFPVTLQVNPSPDIFLRYFMQRDILGDDALTEPIEPSIPAELAVMINNQGAGMAKNVQLESAQPEIVDNEKGLLINFEIIGSSLSGQPYQLGLYNINFGNIDPYNIKIGQWWFTSSLLGHFISYEATVNHLDSYGNQDLSLVSGIDIHELIRSIVVYGDQDDGINDFLVNDIPDVEDTPDKLYYSNGAVADVFVADSAGFDGPVTIDDKTVELTVKPSIAGWNYIKLDDPGSGLHKIVSVTRDDQQEIPLNNVWLTNVTIPDGGEPVYENKLHFIDIFGDENVATYTIVFEPLDLDVPEVLAINGIPESVADQPVTNVVVVFNKAIDAATYTYEDMALTHQGGSNLMDPTVIITPVSGSEYDVDISEKTASSGFYVMTVQAAGIADLVGNYGIVGKQVSWVQAFDVPAIQAFIGLQPILDAPTDTVLVLFNMPIKPATFTGDKIVLRIVDGDTLSSGLLTITPLDAGLTLFKISGLLTFMAQDEIYELTVLVTEIEAENGETGIIDQSVQWSLCEGIMPTTWAGEKDTICQGQTYQLSGIVEDEGSFIWTTSGTGTFDNDQILDPVYTPGTADINNGFVDLTLTAYPVKTCLLQAVSTMKLTIQRNPVANAGGDKVICENQTFTPSGASVSYYSSFHWETSGDGIFSSNQVVKPIYTPGSQDADDGFVVLSLIALPTSPCTDPDTSFMTLTIQKPPLSVAGADTVICEDQTLQLLGAVENTNQFYWTTSGDGSFSQTQVLDPVYTPGSQDKNNGSVVLTLFAQSISPCQYSDISSLTLTIQKLPYVFAGNEGITCQFDAFTLTGAIAMHYDSVYWETNGAGYFDDPKALHPTYLFGVGETGVVELKITAYGKSPCTGSSSSTMLLDIKPPPIAFPGYDATILTGQSYPVKFAIADNSFQVAWSADGTGYFDDPNLLNPTYIPGPGEFGNVTLRMVALGYGSCGSDTAYVDLEITDGINIQVEAKVFLEGPFATSGMNTILNDNNYLPLSQPYSGHPWNYQGAESVAVIPSATIVDWIFVELRHSNQEPGFTVVDRKAGFLLSDGEVKGPDGLSPLTMKIADPGKTRMVIRHRNHLDIISSGIINSMGGSLYSWDFTDGISKAANDRQKPLGGGFFGMFAGDGDGDGEIQIGDVNAAWKIHAGDKGYFNGDFNMNSQVDNMDKNDVWLPNLGQGAQIPE